MSKQYQCRISKSLGGGFDGTPNQVWGTVDYKDRTKPTVFFGCYDLRDFLALWRHKGEAHILWAGGDLNNLRRGFTLNDGKLRWISGLLGTWWVKLILRKAEHWVENYVEKDALWELGFDSQVCPSFLGDVRKYKKQPKPKGKEKYYISCGKGRQVEYGFDVIEMIAPRFPNRLFYLYGDDWKTEHKNVIVRGRVPLKQMNKEIKKMHGSYRLNFFDGFSEITCKSILWGQKAITTIPYPYKSRNDLLKVLNRFPFNAKLLNK